MSSEKSIKKNYIWNTLLTISNIILPLITFPYVSRVLLVEANGKVTFATSVMSYFIMFSALGIPTYGIRACAQVRDDKEKLSKTVEELLLINIFMTILSYAAFLILLVFVPRFYAEKELLLINGVNLLLNCLGMNWLYSALEEYRYITVRSVFFKVLSFGLVFLMVKKPADYLWYASILVFSSVGANILNFIHSRKFIDYKRYSQYEIVKHLKPILYFFATTVAISIYTNLDTVMLGFMSGDIEVGYYGAATKIRTTLASIVVSLGTVLLPRLSYWAQNNVQDQFVRMLERSFQFMFFVSVALSVYFTLFVDGFVLLFAGEAYQNAILSTKILMPTLFFAGLSNVTGTQCLVPLCKEKKMLYSIVAGAVVDLILNAILIPKYASAGAAFATTCAEIVVLAVQVFYIKDILKKVNIIEPMVKTIIAVIPAAVCTQLVFNMLDFGNLVKLAISVIVFGVVYVVILLLLKYKLIMDNLHYLKIRR